MTSIGEALESRREAARQRQIAEFRDYQDRASKMLTGHGRVVGTCGHTIASCRCPWNPATHKEHQFPELCWKCRPFAAPAPDLAPSPPTPEIKPVDAADLMSAEDWAKKASASVLAELQKVFELDPNFAHLGIAANLMPVSNDVAEKTLLVCEANASLTGESRHCRVSVLGIINGCLAAAGIAPVASSWSEDPPDAQPKFLGFVPWTPCDADL